MSKKENIPDIKGSKGIKFDVAKPPLALMPPHALMYLGKVYGFGEVKYKARNYEKGMSWTQVLSASKRHIEKFLGGEDIDPSSLNHLAHAAFGCLTVLEFWLCDVGEDDRSKLKVSEGKLDNYNSDDWYEIALKEKLTSIENEKKKASLRSAVKQKEENIDK